MQKLKKNNSKIAYLKHYKNILSGTKILFFVATQRIKSENEVILILCKVYYCPCTQSSGSHHNNSVRSTHTNSWRHHTVFSPMPPALLSAHCQDYRYCSYAGRVCQTEMKYCHTTQPGDTATAAKLGRKTSGHYDFLDDSSSNPILQN